MSTDEPDPRGHHTLVYDIIQNNLGQGYNKNTGVFTVPKADLFSLTWSTRVACHLAHTTELVINDRILGSTYAYCGYNTVTGHVVATVSQVMTFLCARIQLLLAKVQSKAMNLGAQRCLDFKFTKLMFI